MQAQTNAETRLSDAARDLCELVRKFRTRFVICFVVWLLGWSQSHADIRCTIPPATEPNGPTVKSEDFCEYFKTYRPSGSEIDPRILRAMGLKDSDSDKARRLAIIVGVGEYPNLNSDQNLLVSADNDIQHLIEFLRTDQQFDEIIVLRNKDATRENIEYFLTSYLKHTANSYSGHTQFLFAYSGHGFPSQNTGESAQLALFGISGFDDYDHSLGLGILAQWLRDLSSTNFSSVALINACYGGDIFGTSYGGANPDAPGKPGGWALTAGAADDLVWSSGKSNAGSIFYDLMIDGIKTGKADPFYGQKVVDREAHVVRQESLVRLGQLNGYLTGEIENLGMNPKTSRPYSYPNIGVLQNRGTAQGGFFFLAPRVVVQLPPKPDGTRETNPIGEYGPVSSIYHRADLKVFNDPDDYPIKGVQLSSRQHDIDWSQVKNRVNWVYIRATDFGGSIDSNFLANWSDSAKAGMPRGAYHTFDPCMAPSDQLKTIEEEVPVMKDALPIAIDVAYHSNRDFTENITTCPNLGDEAGIKKSILELANQLRGYYGKLPIIVGDSWAFSNLIDDDFRSFPIWMHEIDNGHPSVRLAGSNPWTLWLTSNASVLPGTQGHFDESVFFGTPAQFAGFQKGSENIALSAAGSGEK
ncbi:MULTISPECIES: GH25 family lysozyme [unclassified Rhizobium]|uniref:GH25 family lysozyme n=1 Tax=unclassified Rhizobium TaxID=2613769 RepID=UPI0013AFEA6D|nr:MULTISPECIES: GH25 family lysozyme [unclassified Rhizobium]MBB3386856.1 lysozyme [Rhizobium sp. BK098]MBB3618749.1 lysozyme [Rhizobium sp. BK609]MBB3684217.1 lysozyme [Rhizobium sp. BK612]